MTSGVQGPASACARRACRSLLPPMQASNGDVAVRIDPMLRMTSLAIDLGRHSHQEVHEESAQRDEHDSQKRPFHIAPPFAVIVMVLVFIATFREPTPPKPARVRRFCNNRSVAVIPKARILARYKRQQIAVATHYFRVAGAALSLRKRRAA